MTRVNRSAVRRVGRIRDVLISKSRMHDGWKDRYAVEVLVVGDKVRRLNVAATEEFAALLEALFFDRSQDHGMLAYGRLAEWLEERNLATYLPKVPPAQRPNVVAFLYGMWQGTVRP